MILPTIFEWLDYLQPLRGFPAVYLVLITAVFVAVAWDWRLSIFALMGLYLSVGLLFVDLIDPHLAFIKVVVGLFVCLMLYFTGRQVNWGRLLPDITLAETRTMKPIRMLRIGPFSAPMILPVRAMLLALLAIIGLLFSRLSFFQLPLLPAELDYLNTAVWGLAVIGLGGVVLADDPLQAGMGLLLFVAGFELFYAGLEQSLLIFAALALVNFGIVLVISYLTQMRFSPMGLLE